MNLLTTTRISLLLFGALGIAACDRANNRTTTLHPGDFERIAQAVARQDDRVSADELARWLIEGKQDFVLVDVRTANAYNEGHIGDAIQMPITELVSPEQLETLPTNRNIVVYSQGSETAAQAVVLLRLAGFNASLLLGGYNFWAQHVLNPDIHPTIADGEFARVPEQQALACYFVGGEQVAKSSEPRPRMKRPAFVPPVSEPAEAQPEQSDEGC